MSEEIAGLAIRIKAQKDTMTKKTVRRTKITASRILGALAIGVFSLMPLIASAYSRPALLRFVNSSTDSVISASVHKVYTPTRKTAPTNIFAHWSKGVDQPLTDSTSIYSDLFKRSVVTDFLESILGHSYAEASSLTAPSITLLNPDTAIAGSPGFLLSVTGANFGVDPVTINFGGTPHVATIDDASHVSATISASEIATSGTILVNVTNATSETSGDLQFTVTNPVPSISQLTPSSSIAGAGAFLLSITGSNFVSGAVIHFGATDYSASINDATHVSATISAADTATAGNISVSVSNPG
ncbi:MAG TPA: IPT/TIG domain-containing protein, partial [Pyrinomonadaceae bacterium]